jgi:hypothetical protein
MVFENPSQMRAQNRHLTVQMKTNIKRLSDPDLIVKIISLLEEDLVVPAVEATARAVLAALRERGYPFDDGDLSDPNCLVCLDLALYSASKIIPKKTSRPLKKVSQNRH